MICPLCKREVVKLIYKPHREPLYQCDECDARHITTSGLQILFRGEGWTKKGAS